MKKNGEKYIKQNIFQIKTIKKFLLTTLKRKINGKNLKKLNVLKTLNVIILLIMYVLMMKIGKKQIKNTIQRMIKEKSYNMLAHLLIPQTQNIDK